MSPFNILCVTETWLSDSIFDYEILPTCYTLYRNDRNSRGGGVLVAVNDSIPSSLVSSPSNLEIICVQLKLPCAFNLCTVYLPPNSDLSYFESLIDFLSDILSSCIPCIIVGDFNLPNICWSTFTGNSSVSTFFCDFIFNWNLTQHILVPTHIEGNILDLVLTSENIQISDLSINCPSHLINSDHFIISFNLNCGRPLSVINKAKYVFDYNNSKADWDGLCSYLLGLDFSGCFQSNNIEFIWDTVKSIIYEAMCRYIPKVKLKTYRNPPWFNSSIRHHINCLRTLRKNINTIPLRMKGRELTPVK